MLKIANIIPGAPADSGELKPGDKLLTINGVEVKDFIDFRYAEAEEELKIAFLRGEKQFTLAINKEIDQNLGLEFEPDRIIRCRNKCIFCFCHNNPRQLRRSLYVKDDDYRYSFLHGSFITMTNLAEADIERIISLRLSPMYISVHATDIDTRKQLFGRDNVPSVMPVLKRFAENGIEFHCQVVVVPGYNDNDILYKTADDLASLRPYASSLAVVPVGLTNFSRPDLRSVGPKSALELINAVNDFRLGYGEPGNQFAYAADELFIKAGLSIPEIDYYDDFPQIENGIGMVRDFLDTFPRKIPANIGGYWVTSRSMSFIWRKYLMPKYDLDIKLIPVTNELFGPKVTVSGLLSGRDILNTLKRRKLKTDQPIVLPPNCLNHDGLFIDDLTVADLENELKMNVVQGSYSFKETLRMVS